MNEAVTYSAIVGSSNDVKVHQAWYENAKVSLFIFIGTFRYMSHTGDSYAPTNPGLYLLPQSHFLLLHSNNPANYLRNIAVTPVRPIGLPFVPLHLEKLTSLP